MAPDPLSPFRIADLTPDGFGRDKFLSLRREMNSLFDDVFSGHMPSTEGGEGPTLMPQIDVSETERELKIDAELPGLSDNEIEVRLENDVLVIRAEKKFECKGEKENYHLIERSYGTFQRALRLPGPVDMDQVQARLEHGVLTASGRANNRNAHGKSRSRGRALAISRNQGNSKGREAH
jgi:HSP20 family protein